MQNALMEQNEEDQENDQENSIYFTNEEKLISNSLKVNFFSQLFIIGIFTFAATMADWTHIIVKLEDSSYGYDTLVYHITLMTMKVGTSMNDFLISGDDFDWLQEVS